MREASVPARGAHGLPDGRRASRLPRRLAPAPAEEAVIARELEQDGQLARDHGGFLEGPTGLLRRAPGGSWPAGRAVGAPAALAARLCFSGALAVTALAVAYDGVGERRARERSCFEGSGSGAMARLGAGLRVF